MLVRIANREDPDLTASSEASLIWVCPMCLGRFGRQLVFEILEHLPYLNICLYIRDDIIQLLTSISADMRIYLPEKVIFTEATRINPHVYRN